MTLILQTQLYVILLLTLFLLLLLLLLFFRYPTQLYVYFNRPFAASMECLPAYQTTDEVKCDFHLTNVGDRAYSVLQWNTPLNALSPSGLVVTRDGKKLEFDGIVMKREDPGLRDFLTIAAGETVSSKIDLSSGYDTAKAGTFTVAVDTYLEYVEGSVSSMRATGNTAIQTKLTHLSSSSVIFQLVGKSSFKRTLGQQARSLEGKN